VLYSHLQASDNLALHYDRDMLELVPCYDCIRGRTSVT
jgi:hypothetical protein